MSNEVNWYAKKTFINRPKFKGQIKDMQMKEYKDAFDIFDTSGSGTIDYTELKVAMKSMGLKPTPEEINAIIAEADTECSGVIDFGSFLNVMIS